MKDYRLLLLHPSDTVRTRIARALTQEGAEVIHATTEASAAERLRQAPVPHGVVAYDFGNASNSGSRLLRPQLDFPLVVLADDRRLALRQGFSDVVEAPFDDEEIVLVTYAALERWETEGNLSGNLDQLSFPDLLQTSAAAGRSGHIQLRRRGVFGDLWLREGRVINAQIDDPGSDRSLAGRQAVFEMLTWQEGAFTVDFCPVSMPERIHESTAQLLLEGMRLWDESNRPAEPEHAGLPDEPPATTLELKAAHHALLLLNVTCSWMSDCLMPEVLADRLEESRRHAASAHPLLDRLQVDAATGRVTYRPSTPLPTSHEIDPWVEAVSAWLKAFGVAAERAVPGRFSADQLAVLTGAHRQELTRLGFAAALGWPESIQSRDEKDRPAEPAPLTEPSNISDFIPRTLLN